MALTELQTDYAGRRGPLFKLAMVTGLLTVLTLGFYRFWMKTRLRRYYWSAIRPGGVGLEYVGTAYEKLMGFLTAVVFLAFYIGVVNLILMFFSFTLFQDNLVAYGLSFAGILPIIFFAQYRARRYVLARTRWRGIRFGLDPGAWGYAWRVMVHWLITIGSLGLLWPRMTFWLEKYRTDRTYFGDQRLHQGGRWTMLLGAMKHMYFSVGLSVAVIGAAVFAETPSYLWMLMITLPWAGFGLAYWKAQSFRRLTNAKELGPVGLRAQPRSGRVFFIYWSGYLLTSIVVSVALTTVITVAAALIGFDRLDQMTTAALEGGDIGDFPAWLFTLMAVSSYFALFLFWGAATQIFVKLPLARHFSETIEITNGHELASIAQRGRDEFVEAEGFAEALDVGAAL